MGRWGDRRWGDREMGRWGDGEMGKWGNGEVGTLGDLERGEGRLLTGVSGDGERGVGDKQVGRLGGGYGEGRGKRREGTNWGERRLGREERRKRHIARAEGR